MADPLLALIGAITLGILGFGALVSLLIISVQGFLVMFKWVGTWFN